MLENLGEAALGLGIIAAGVWNGLETVRTRRLTRTATAQLEQMAPLARETHRQVSVNRHVSNPPTLLDKIDRVHTEVGEAKRALAVAGRMFDGHITASADDRAELWRHVAQLERVIGIPPTKGTQDEQPDLT